MSASDEAKLTPDTLRSLVARGPWTQTDLLKPYADAWEAEVARQVAELAVARMRLDAQVAEVARMRKLLRRLSEWDMMSDMVGASADGPYWRGEIAAALAAGEKP